MSNIENKNSFKEKYLRLLELDQKYMNIEYEGEYIWPYVRNKIYGLIHSENIKQNNTKIFHHNQNYLTDKNELSLRTDETDTLVVMSNRNILDGNKRIDPITNVLSKYDLGNVKLLSYKSENSEQVPNSFDMNIAHTAYSQVMECNDFALNSTYFLSFQKISRTIAEK